MMASILVNWFFGLQVGKFKENKNVRWLIALDVFVNLAIIFIYKYLAFTVKNLNLVLHAHWKVPEIALPIGISFFTFQAISYVIDVYRGRGEAQKNLLNVGLYISFFPQLIAGPIVRYETIADQINNRKENLQDFSDGVVRFIIGLGKKVLLANNMALIADHAFGFGNGTVQWFGADMPLTAGMAWLGALAYTCRQRHVRIWPSDWEKCSDSTSMKTSIIRTFPVPLRNSGDAGTSLCPAGSGIMSIFRWAETE